MAIATCARSVLGSAPESDFHWTRAEARSDRAGRWAASSRHARRAARRRAAPSPRRAVRPRMCNGRGTWRRRLQAQVLLSSCAWQSPLIRLDTTSGETSDSIRNNRPVSGIHSINDTTIDKNRAAGDPPHKRRREKPQLCSQPSFGFSDRQRTAALHAFGGHSSVFWP